MMNDRKKEKRVLSIEFDRIISITQPDMLSGLDKQQ